MFPVAKLTAADVAFPARVLDIMPSYEVAASAKVDPKWSRLFSDWFYYGLDSLEITPREGVDVHAAKRHLAAVLGSFEPKHEHKTAAFAFLCNEWFSDATWSRAERKP